MRCTECPARAPQKGARWLATDRAAAERDGWFFWTPGTPIRFEGTVMCPACRARPYAHDAFGDKWETAELEERASRARGAA